MGNFPDNMNWQAFDRRWGDSEEGESLEQKPAKPEYTVLSECDDCESCLMLNETGLCKSCNDTAEAYADSLVKAYQHQKLQLRIPTNPETYHDKGEAL